ncbi:MAG: nucleotide sugar dehydrogenase, partial [Nitrospira sp.]|nr:nucleotide sugar dehydrogenase [Nitrospira sp.]
NEHGGKTWHFDDTPSSPSPVAIICVSTPVSAGGTPNVSHVRQAARALSGTMPDRCLVITRSTVPIGTTRNVVLPELAKSGTRFSLAYCPERTIQGQALRELIELPQVVGALDRESAEAAESFFRRLQVRVVPISSLEAAEMVKLANNCHTDLIYGYGNEIASIAEGYHLDPLEIIRAANAGYPRPDLCKPGFVGGPCLTKDPLLFAHSARERNYRPYLIKQARALNAGLPGRFAKQMFAMLQSAGIQLAQASVLVCGIAYKGSPVTDDMRGAASIPFIRKISQKVRSVWAHDFLVKPSTLCEIGARPVSLQQGFRLADAVVFLTNHPDYEKLDLLPLLSRSRRPLVYLDAWRMHDARPELMQPGILYGGLGFVRKGFE